VALKAFTWSGYHCTPYRASSQKLCAFLSPALQAGVSLQIKNGTELTAASSQQGTWAAALGSPDGEASPFPRTHRYSQRHPSSRAPAVTKV